MLWRPRERLSLRDLTARFLERGFVFTYEAVREREDSFAPLLMQRLDAKQRSKEQPGASSNATI